MKIRKVLIEISLCIFVLLGAWSTESASEPVSNIVLRQIWAPALDTSGGVSPDGQYLSLVDGKTGGLAVRDLTTGSTRRLTNETSQLSIGFVLESVFSPDGKQIAHTSYNREGGVELRTISLTGAQPRVLLHRTSKDSSIALKDWSPNGKLIASVTFDAKAKESRLVLVSTLDDNVVTFKSGSRLVSAARFSPDSRFIACTCQSFIESQQRDIVLFEISNGQETQLVAHPADDFVLGWAPGRANLLFSSDRRGIADLWSLDVEGSKANGQPLLLKANLGQVSPLGVTKSGALLFKVPVQSSDLYRAAIDFETGKVLTGPMPVPVPFSGRVRNNNISFDGRYFAFGSQRTFPDSIGRGESKMLLHVLDFQSGVRRDFGSSSRYSMAHGPTWLPDHKTLVIHGTRNDATEEIAAVNIETGELTVVAGEESDSTIEYLGQASMAREFTRVAFAKDVFCLRKYEEGRRFVLVRCDLRGNHKAEYEILKDASQGGQCHFALNADQRSVFCTSIALEKPNQMIWTIWLRYLESNTTIELMRSGTPTVLRRSPDPNLFAIMESGRKGRESLVRFFEIDAGQRREKLNVALPKSAELWWWTPDARYMLFLKKTNETEDSPVELWSISAQTGNISKTDLVMPEMRLVNIHPDGKQVLFRSRDRDTDEVWIMENFLPQITSKQ